MDLTPETLRAATFRDKLRGYHPDDVDEFLESVARGLEVLLARLRDASERARAVAAPAEPTHDADEAVRTLTLAQRTADLAIQEAKAEAERLLKAADVRARKLIGDAEETSTALAEQAQADLRTDLDKLQAARDQLFAEVSAMGSWLQGERSRIRRALVEIADRVENVREAKDGPAQRPVQAPAPPRQKMQEARARREEQVAAGVVPDPPVKKERAATAEPAAKPEPPAKTPPAAAPAARTTPPRGQPAVMPPLPASEPSPTPFVPEPAEPGDAGVLARAQSSVSTDEDMLDDDPYFAELRRAMTDETPLGPRDDDDWDAGLDSNPQQNGRTL
ncbi:MAG: cell division initiation protein [Actinomycetota bacterium]|jgi:cell division initiation protein